MPRNIDFRAELLDETDDYYLFFDGDSNHYIDKELVREMEQIGRKPQDVSVSIPEWLAIKKGII